MGSELGRAQLKRLNKLHADAHSHDALAAAPFNYVALAEMHASALDGLLGFTPSTVGDARRLATALRERPARGASLEAADEVARRLEPRDRIATLLHHRVGQVRAAARNRLQAPPGDRPRGDERLRAAAADATAAEGVATSRVR